MTAGVRVCRTCGVEKPLTEFYREPRSIGGRRRSCKTCVYPPKRLDRDPSISTGTVVAGRKLCGICREVLPIESFGKNRSRKCGLQWACKPCCVTNDRLRRAKVVPEKVRRFPAFKGYEA